MIITVVVVVLEEIEEKINRIVIEERERERDSGGEEKPFSNFRQYSSAH